jgi:uncharacterized protein YhfF
MEKAKDFYLHKNVEVEQLIKQVMTGQKTSAMSQDLKPESVESLLKFLTYIVLNQEQTSDDASESKSLLEMLKTDDQLRNQLFGHL